MGKPAVVGAIVCAAAWPAVASARSPQAERAAMVADLLASLDASAPAPVAKRVAARRTLDRLGAHPLDGEPKPKVAEEAPFRGRVLGPGYQRGWLEAGEETKLEQQFLAGQRATIAVAGAPAALLKLTVVEPGEQPVCRDAARACRWLPLYTQRYAITLRNEGPARVRYYLVLD